jgi:hypothetical protein
MGVNKLAAVIAIICDVRKSGRERKNHSIGKSGWD